jgi:hypothetical protein
MLTPVKSVEGYLNAVWKVATPDSCVMKLYRGQADDWPLLPKLFRPPDGTKRSDPDWIEKIKDVEQEMLRRFKNDSPYLLPSKPDNDWDWLSLGQHYGLATRLEDWTANPLNALFFAVEEPAAPKPTVYIYPATQPQMVTGKERKGSSKLSPFVDDRNNRVFQPSSHSLRVAMQAGWHMAHHIHKGREGEKVLPLGEMEWHAKRIIKIFIAPGSSGGIREQLEAMGIRHATMFPDLQSVCRSINALIRFS